MIQPLTTFDLVDLLDSEEAINEYLSQVIAEGDKSELLRAEEFAITAIEKIRAELVIGESSGEPQPFDPEAFKQRILSARRVSFQASSTIPRCTTHANGNVTINTPAKTIIATGTPNASPTPPNTTGASAPPPIVPV